MTLCFAGLLFCVSTQADGLPIKDLIATTKDVGSLMRIYAELEASWPTNSSEYFQRQNELNAALQSISTTNAEARLVFDRQASLTLEKTHPKEICFYGNYFWAKNEIIVRVAGSASMPSLTMAQRMARTLGEVRDGIITNYHWKTVYVNVAPPVTPKSTNSGPISSGMTVDMISDPVAREAYERDIESNEVNKVQNDLQTSILPRSNRAITIAFLKYTKKLFVFQPKARSQLDELTKSAHLTEEERRQLE